MWRFAPAGDGALLVTLGSTIDPALLAEVVALDQALTDHPPAGLRATVPAYASLLCHVDPEQTTLAEVEGAIRSFEGRLPTTALTGRLMEVATRYDGADLGEVASLTGLTAAEVIERHAGREYLVYCVGFAPGFAYCGELAPDLVVPRKSSPRLRVPAGSVGIAGRQTGIYAVESPGGWQLIGRTDARLFDPRAEPPARFKPGDRIRFVPTR